MLGKNISTVRSIVMQQCRRCLASKASSATAANLSSSFTSDVKTSTLPSGITLASVPSDLALARIAVVIRAGARYEPRDQLGLTHILRSSAGLSTESYTNFGITRNIEYYGGSLSVATSRDTISYLLEVHNDEVARSFAILADTITSPAFKNWELSDNLERINADLSVVADSPYIQLAEALHSIAYKGGLRKSLYSPSFMVGKHTSEALKKYVKERFVGPNTAVVGVGLELEELTALVGQSLALPSHQPSKCQAKYIGGEIHIDSASPQTYVALATEGAGLKSGKEAVALQLFQTILGAGPQIKNQNGLSQATRLGKALSGAGSSGDVAVSAFNFAYENTGLFGFNLIAPNTSDITSLVKVLIKEFRLASTTISDSELNDAKNNLKTSILLTIDQGDSYATELASQLLLSGSDISSLVTLVDSITAADVKTASLKLLKSKPSLATIGLNAPYLDDLVEL